MPDRLSADQFLANSNTAMLLDTRSPGEYAAGHIPGAISFPLFTDDERAKVGICFKHSGQEAAIELGLDLVGPKLVSFVRQAKELVPDRLVRLHCWRGGMRSSSMAWLLETAGFQVQLLEGGYKTFRRWVRSTLATPKQILTLGGMTGTGKTTVLETLAAKGQQVLDLEHWASHRGSSYGALGLPPQPTQEQFDNCLGIAWAKLSADRPVWIEAESRRVGLCAVPDELFGPMMAAPIWQIERSRSERLDILTPIYGVLPTADLVAATQRIARKLGGEKTNRAIVQIEAGNLRPAIDLVLDYYDKCYQYDLDRRGVVVHPVEAIGLSDIQVADRLIAMIRSMPNI
jgi:tRNA 2-selenouridine synthase